MGMTTIVKLRPSCHCRGGPVGVRGVAAWLSHWQLRHRGPDTHVLLRHGVLGWPRHYNHNGLIGISDFRTRSQSSVWGLPRATLCLDHLGLFFWAIVLVVPTCRSRWAACLFDTAGPLQRYCLQKNSQINSNCSKFARNIIQFLATCSCCLVNLSSPTELSGKSTGVGGGELWSCSLGTARNSSNIES